MRRKNAPSKLFRRKILNSAEAERNEIARVVGIGAVKYGDLQQNRQSDYVFSWDKMLSLQGNTAPYLQYAYSAGSQYFSKAESSNTTSHRTSNIQLIAAEEIALAKHLLNFGLVLEAVADDYRPNFLCSFLYELAGHFARFYENCPVLKAEEAERNSRLALVQTNRGRFETRPGASRNRNRRADVRRGPHGLSKF